MKDDFGLTASGASIFSRAKVTNGGYIPAGKRAFDLAFGIAVAPIVLPVISILALLVMSDGGPAFYRQQRIGRHGRPFHCLKLRTMVVDADERLAEMLASDKALPRHLHRHQKLDNDPRTTRIGNFLRKSSLDELPQFLNVLAGQMSFVGPRPFMPEQEPLYRTAGGRSYFQLRPGISGLWQLRGRGKTAFVARVRYDEHYARTASVANDIKIILQTIAFVLKMNGR